jgi:putative FmdB family regulatory protein
MNMPIYCYKCCECGNKVEVLQKMGADPLKECPECTGCMEKIIGPVAVIFKGSGFYKNDYKSGGGRREETSHDTSGDSSADKPADKPGDKSGDKSGDTPGDKSGDTSGDKSGDTSKESSSAPAKSDGKKNVSGEGAAKAKVA